MSLPFPVRASAGMKVGIRGVGPPPAQTDSVPNHIQQNKTPPMELHET